MALHPVSVRAWRDSAPLFLPAIPFAMVLGLAISESVMPAAVGMSSNLIIFAGAAQLATVSLAAAASWLTLVATASVINLRHVMYSAALAPRFQHQPRWFRWVGPLVLVDQVFALVSARSDLDHAEWRRYFLSCGVFFFTCWNIAVTVGLIAGGTIPEQWRLEAAPAIMFAGLVVLGLSSRPGVIAAVTGAVVCFAALDVPNSGGILVGAIAGVLAGYLADRALAGQPVTDEQGPA